MIMFDQSDNLKRLTDHVFEHRPLYKIETTVSAWQRCPICDGTGRIPTDGTATIKACDVCAGKKIISTFSGKPPAD